VERLRDLVVVSVATAVVSVPSVLWFLTNADDPVERSWHGFAEKIFFTALAAWTAYAGGRLATDVTQRSVPALENEAR
jgi:hypothetical protein